MVEDQRQSKIGVLTIGLNSGVIILDQCIVSFKELTF
jgi:hypothetical protein